jgi:hypothetical protein
VGYSRYRLPYSSDINGKLEAIARARVSLKLGRIFDWELQLEDSVSPDDAERMLDECKAAGKPAQYVGFASGIPPVGEDWLALSRRQNLGFSFAGMDDPAAIVDAARGLGGRFNCRVSESANLQALATALFG